MLTQGNLDMAYPGLILANAALGEGRRTCSSRSEASTWINKKTMGDLKFTMLGNTATHMPLGLSCLPA